MIAKLSIKNIWRNKRRTLITLAVITIGVSIVLREVMLHANGKPLILARTIIPASTIKAAKSNLSRLGNRPLGEIIFSYPKLERIAMDVALVKQSTWTQSAIAEAGIAQPIWGRRTVYAIAHKQMLVSEFFLPEILEG